MLLACRHRASHPGPHVVDCVHFDQAEHPAMSGIMTVFVTTRHAETNTVVQLQCPASGDFGPCSWLAPLASD